MSRQLSGLRALTFGLGFLLTACSSSNPHIDKNNPPSGATPAEYGFQYAQVIAKNGNCDQALPIFICLGEQGRGWELAMHSGGVCALEAAKLWTGPLARRAGFYGKQSRVSFDKPYFHSQAALRAKGLALLRRSAAAGWPDSQAVLVRELSGPAAPAMDLGEAKLWLHQYDLNARRKIYGGNTLGSKIRARLAGVTAASMADDKALHQDIAPQPPHDRFCRQVIARRPAIRQRQEDDGLEKLPGRPAPRQRRRAPDQDGDGD